MFYSNCFLLKDINFRIEYEDNAFINFNYHPTEIELNILGNIYVLTYKNSYIIDRFDVMRSVEYGEVRVDNAQQQPRTLNVLHRNGINLAP